MEDIIHECSVCILYRPHRSLNPQCLESGVFNVKNANPGRTSHFIPCSTWGSSIITLLIFP